jgi:Helix-turn-helix domain
MIPTLATKLNEILHRVSSLQPSTEQKSENDGWLSTKKAALYLSMSENTFDKFCRETTPRIKGHKVGGKNYYKKSDLDTFMRMFALKSAGFA